MIIDEEHNDRKWLRKHASIIKCPPCDNKKRPDRLADHVVQTCCICPKCKKIWIYKIRIEQEVAKRIPSWRYSKRQTTGVIE